MTQRFIRKMEAALKFIPYPNVVMIFSLAAFLQENVRHARWGHSESTGRWRSFMVKIARGSDVEACQAHPLVSFHSGCFFRQSPQCKVYKTFVCRWSSLFAMFRKHVESPSWTFSFSLSFYNRGFLLRNHEGGIEKCFRVKTTLVRRMLVCKYHAFAYVFWGVLHISSWLYLHNCRIYLPLRICRHPCACNIYIIYVTFSKKKLSLSKF